MSAPLVVSSFSSSYRLSFFRLFLYHRMTKTKNKIQMKRRRTGFDLLFDFNINRKINKLFYFASVDQTLGDVFWSFVGSFASVQNQQSARANLFVVWKRLRAFGRLPFSHAHAVSFLFTSNDIFDIYRCTWGKRNWINEWSIEIPLIKSHLPHFQKIWILRTPFTFVDVRCLMPFRWCALFHAIFQQWAHSWGLLSERFRMILFLWFASGNHLCLAVTMPAMSRHKLWMVFCAQSICVAIEIDAICDTTDACKMFRVYCDI